jgi:CBS domain containing-hemolysin-like protein
MFVLIVALVLALLSLLFISLQKTYTYLPRPELKRRAQSGDELAGRLYRVAGYGFSLQVLLWALIVLSASGFFVLVSRSLPAWLAVIVSLAILWFGFVWLPNTRVTKFGNMLARAVTPALSWILDLLQPMLSRLATTAGKHHTVSLHTGLYQKEDLLNLLDRQKTQVDSRINDADLQIAQNALTYGDKLVRDVLTPRRVVKMIAATDTIGPVLMDELHANGHSRFPVYQDKTDNIVGTLYLRDLMASKSGGRVRDLMSKDVFYVQEEGTLDHVLEAFLKTKHHLFIVVNNFEEVVGIITIEDVLEQILGKPIMGEFDKYDDMRAVAAMEASRTNHAHANDNPEPSSQPVKDESD